MIEGKHSLDNAWAGQTRLCQVIGVCVRDLDRDIIVASQEIVIN